MQPKYKEMQRVRIVNGTQVGKVAVIRGEPIAAKVSQTWMYRVTILLDSADWHYYEDELEGEDEAGE